MAHALSKIVRREEIQARVNREKQRQWRQWWSILKRISKDTDYEPYRKKGRTRRILEQFDPLHYHTLSKIRGGNPPRAGLTSFLYDGAQAAAKLGSWIAGMFSKPAAKGALAAIGKLHATPGEIQQVETAIQGGVGLGVGATTICGGIWLAKNYPILYHPLQWFHFLPSSDDNSILAEGIRAAVDQQTNAAKAVEDYLNQEYFDELREYLRENPAVDETMKGLHITLNEAEDVSRNGVRSTLYALPLLGSYFGFSAALGKARFLGNLASLISMLVGLDPAKRMVIFTLFDLIGLFIKIYKTPKEQRSDVFKESCKDALELLFSRICAGKLSTKIWRSWVPGILGWFREKITDNIPFIGWIVNYLASTRPGQWVVGTLDEIFAQQIKILIVKGKDPAATAEFITGEALYKLVKTCLEPMGEKLWTGMKTFVDFITSKEGEAQLRVIGRSVPNNATEAAAAAAAQANQENGVNVDLVPEDDIPAANASASASASDPGPSATTIVVRPQFEPSLPDDDDDDLEVENTRRQAPRRGGVKRGRPRTEEEVLEDTVTNIIKPAQRRRLNKKNKKK